jgi:hypothetical protein
MADTNPLLQQLADISEPPLQPGFALAPLWWCLIMLATSAICYLVWRLYRRWRFFAAKRQALILLKQVSKKDNAATEINQLLKRVLQHYQPEHPALSMSPMQWQCWLASQQHQALPDLTPLLYQPGEHAEATTQFYQFAKSWLKNYRAKAPVSSGIPEVSNA